MDIDHRIADRYAAINEDERLWIPGTGDLVRLRTWDIFDRYIPAGMRIADIGGGPGAHAAYLAGKGNDVIMFDPIARHVETARARSMAQSQASFRVELAEARQLPLADEAVDVALLMGPLYHLIDPRDRQVALQEALRVMVPGGQIMAEIITRHAWLIEATARNMLAEPMIWKDFERNISTGLSQDPDNPPEGGFFAYFHTLDEIREDLTAVGFTEITLIAVEGFGRLLGDLDQRLIEPSGLMQALRLAETEPSMLGVSAHVIGWARKP
ncbi:MAG TPA: class I SAM-dependent methyltransferase [Micromonosporaceae bacterium]|nr:class I SAM-dependent methyltransferase [Micromonosporaceae bacterium]HCU48791.1 class I SAM-dependent methyltransferase [Micromonosporaceae bacterium]